MTPRKDGSKTITETVVDVVKAVLPHRKYQDFQSYYQDDEADNGAWKEGLAFHTTSRQSAMELAKGMYVEDGKEESQSVKVKLLHKETK